MPKAADDGVVEAGGGEIEPEADANGRICTPVPACEQAIARPAKVDSKSVQNRRTTLRITPWHGAERGDPLVRYDAGAARPTAWLVRRSGGSSFAPMIPFLILAGLAPVAAAFGVLFWAGAVRGNKEAAGLAKSIGIALATGVLLGVTVSGLLLALVLGIRHLRG
ncbi:MAG: hypothetical protein ACR2PL_19615 [Dehalococcoidia bacterium]